MGVYNSVLNRSNIILMILTLFCVSGTITALVGLRVLNKTSEEYWFLMKINVTVNKGDLNMKGMQPKITGYFLLRLQILPR